MALAAGCMSVRVSLACANGEGGGWCIDVEQVAVPLAQNDTGC